MDKSEIALQLTLKALEVGAISKTGLGMQVQNESKKSENKFASEQIADFYNSILQKLA